jgi:3-phosphoglycerate kinase|tara:strand:+ start:8275 stop:9447 length:1173 start_codon:yes stop_codon:yes gene_type:complete
MIKINSIKDNNFDKKKCLLRLDLNIPLSDSGEILDDTRIIESIPTINYLQSQNAIIIIISHIGRPKGKFVKDLSFSRIYKKIEKLMNKIIHFIPLEEQSNINKILSKATAGEIYLLDNLRFNRGEEESSRKFIEFLSSFSDVFINDGFGTIHRNHSSITGIAKILPSYGGILLEKEINDITECLRYSSNNSVAILGGSKISDKIPIIENLSKSFNEIVITGGMIRPFLIAAGKIVSDDLSNYTDEVKIAEKILNTNHKIYIPEQLVCSENMNSEPTLLHCSQIKGQDNIYDIGPNSMMEITEKILISDKIIWNGPPGVFENKNFQLGTKTLIMSINQSESKIKVAGGGSTIAAINHFGSNKNFTHISTGGGAFLSLLEGKFLEGIEVLKT